MDNENKQIWNKVLQVIITVLTAGYSNHLLCDLVYGGVETKKGVPHRHHPYTFVAEYTPLSLQGNHHARFFFVLAPAYFGYHTAQVSQPNVQVVQLRFFLLRTRFHIFGHPT